MYLVSDIKLFKSIYENYRSSKYFFPLIGAVLEGKQVGQVYVDDKNKPKTILVIHKFLFAQIISENLTKKDFENICTVIDAGTNYNNEPYNKIRFYCAEKQFIKYINGMANYDYQVGNRIRFVSYSKLLIDKNESAEIKDEDLILLDKQLNLEVGNRFWSGNIDFIRNSYAYYIKENSCIKSICYASAVSDGKAEIDVATHPDYRKMGFAKRSVIGFIANCKKNGVQPLWDCYDNNTASIQTAKSVGFKEIFNYLFLIINKN